MYIGFLYCWLHWRDWQLRLVYLNQPVGNDEAFTYLAFSSRSIITILTDYSHPNNHILHSLLVFFSTRLFGGEAWAVRLPALIAGTLLIPAGYIAARRMYNSLTGLLAASFIAVFPHLIAYSNSARGYTLVCLAATLCVFFAAGALEENKVRYWVGVAIFAIIGFYAIPIMLYPFAGICTWILLSIVWKSGLTKTSLKKLIPMVILGLSVIVVVIILYLPVVIWGSGFSSIVSNGVVTPEPFNQFSHNLIARLGRTWQEWNEGLLLLLSILQVLGLLVSLVIHRRAARQPVHLLPALVLGVLPIILWQRVAPWTRIWLFVLPLYAIWAAAGLISLTGWLMKKLDKRYGIVVIAILCIIPFADRVVRIAQEGPANINAAGVEQNVAEFLVQEVSPGDMIVAVTPMSTQIKFYFWQAADYERWFYNTNIQQTFSNLIVLVGTKYGDSLESVLEKNHLSDQIDRSTFELVYTYKHVEVYRVEALNP